MKFVLEIKLGNDAMLTSRDVAQALFKVAARIERSAPPTAESEAHKILDENGQGVGSWRFKQ